MTLDGHLKTGLMFALVVMAQPEQIIPGEFKLIVALCVFLGNVAPDFLEFGIIPHRTYTHYPVLWLCLLLFSGFSLGASSAPLLESIPFWTASYSWCILGLSVGCLWHIICDWPYYGGIPILSPTRKVALFRWEFDGVANRVFEHSMLFLGGTAIFANSAVSLSSSVSW